MDQLNKIFNFVAETCTDFAIDESHGLKHSIDVYRYADQIYLSELANSNNQELVELYQIIIFSAALHDMCDYKYIGEDIGIQRIINFLSKDLKLGSEQIELICKIITSISYTKIKKVGFAQFDKPLHQLAYNIVREADLLTAYDFDRSIIYAMINKKMTWSDAINETVRYFKIRVLTQISDGLFITKFGLEQAQKLHKQTLAKINQ